MSEENRDLYYLNELSDYKVASDYPDVRDWLVIDSTEQVIGRVDNLLVSKKAERVVYLDIEVDESVIEGGGNAYAVPASEGVHEFLNADGEKHLIIPIGVASLDENNNRVRANGLDYETFATAKRFRKGDVIVPDYELHIYKHYSGDDTLNNSSIADGSFYNRKEFTGK